jgi:hypothetical protein
VNLMTLPKPPSWLDKDAKREFKRITAALADLDMVRSTDVSVLAMTLPQTAARGFLVGLATAATAGPNYMQCVDAASCGDDAVIDLEAIP